MVDNKLPFALAFERQYPGPLDPTMVFATDAERIAYLSSPLCYPGQVVTVPTASAVYVVNEDKTAYNEIKGNEIVVFNDPIDISYYCNTTVKKATIALTLQDDNELLLGMYNDVFGGYIISYIPSSQLVMSMLADAINEHNNTTNRHSIANIAGLTAALAAKAAVSHVHTIANITSLQTTLDAKAALSHVHAIANITSLQATLDAKAALSHEHTIANITSLQAALDAKAALAHEHTLRITNIAGLQATLDAKAALAHMHEIANVTGLELALDLKAATEHDHLIDEIIGLQAALDAKADTVNVNGILESTDNWAYAADNGNIIVQGTASVGTFTIKVKYKLYQSAVTKSVNLFPSSMKCGSYVRFELCEYCRDTTRGDGGYYPRAVGFTINKFFDYNTPYSGSPSTLSNEVGAGYMYENQQDDSNWYFGLTQRSPYNAITLTVNHDNYSSEGNTWIVVLLTGTIL